MKKSVLVGMSGGVDSSTTLAMMQDRGFNVVGVTLKLSCKSMGFTQDGVDYESQDIYDAKKVAKSLGILHYVIDYRNEFKRDIIENFIDGYKSGITPLPCTRCNKMVKFYNMIKLADELGIDYIATGHYARKIDGQNEVELHTAIDKSKDQSFFLFGITQEQLKRTFFPLGEFTKSQTREIARKFNISVSEKSESQDICFVSGSYRDFLQENDVNLAKTGDIIRIETGEIVGKHNGALFYTKGQRRGTGVGGSVVPLYVIDTDIAKNIVYVGEEDLLFTSEFLIKDINFIGKKYENLDNFECNVVIRALQNEIPAIITKIDQKNYKVQLKIPGRAITKGQACVMYLKTMVIGGGVIL